MANQIQNIGSKKPQEIWRSVGDKIDDGPIRASNWVD